MKSFRPLALLATGLLLAAPLAAEPVKPLYQNDFEGVAVDAVPEGMMVMAGLFTVKQGKDGKFLELPGEPLDTFGALFGPAGQGDLSVSARFFGTKQGRKFPSFGLSLGGVGGFRLVVSPGKKALEIFRGDEVKTSVPFEWVSEAWTSLRLQLRKGKDGAWLVEGKAWPSGGAEPAQWMVTLEEKEEPATGRAGLWGSPYSGTPIRFDDLVIKPAS
jgi:hypothetical protein